MHARERSYEILAYENKFFQLLANHTKICTNENFPLYGTYHQFLPPVVIDSYHYTVVGKCA